MVSSLYLQVIDMEGTNLSIMMGVSIPETIAVYSGFFFDDVVLLLDVSS